jgi:hypothetical protein
MDGGSCVIEAGYCGPPETREKRRDTCEDSRCRRRGGYVAGHLVHVVVFPVA